MCSSCGKKLVGVLGHVSSKIVLPLDFQRLTVFDGVWLRKGGGGSSLSDLCL